MGSKLVLGIILVFVLMISGCNDILPPWIVDQFFPEYHGECRQGMCIQVQNEEDEHDECYEDSDCHHYDCLGEICKKINEPGKDECNYDDDCMPGGDPGDWDVKKHCGDGYLSAGEDCDMADDPNVKKGETAKSYPCPEGLTCSKECKCGKEYSTCQGSQCVKVIGEGETSCTSDRTCELQECGDGDVNPSYEDCDMGEQLPSGQAIPKPCPAESQECVQCKCRQKEQAACPPGTYNEHSACANDCDLSHSVCLMNDDGCYACSVKCLGDTFASADCGGACRPEECKFDVDAGCYLCNKIACHATSDCGEVTKKRVCYNDDVYEQTSTPSCSKPGPPDAQCKFKTSGIFMGSQLKLPLQDCEPQYCWNGECVGELPTTTTTTQSTTTTTVRVTTTTIERAVTPRCGDGYLSWYGSAGGGNEECDLNDNPQYSGPGSQAYNCPGSLSCVDCKCKGCGDGRQDAGEECDSWTSKARVDGQYLWTGQDIDCPGQMSCSNCRCIDKDSDGDGVPDSVDKCPGYNDALDADGDGIPDYCDDQPINCAAHCAQYGWAVGGYEPVGSCLPPAAAGGVCKYACRYAKWIRWSWSGWECCCGHTYVGTCPPAGNSCTCPTQQELTDTICPAHKPTDPPYAP